MGPTSEAYLSTTPDGGEWKISSELLQVLENLCLWGNFLLRQLLYLATRDKFMLNHKSNSNDCRRHNYLCFLILQDVVLFHWHNCPFPALSVCVISPWISLSCNFYQVVSLPLHLFFSFSNCIVILVISYPHYMPCPVILLCEAGLSVCLESEVSNIYALFNDANVFMAGLFCIPFV